MSQAKTFGRYNLVRKVAQGGMAEIFLAKFQGIGGFEKKIIIKRILPRFSENQEFIKMLIHEAKTAVQLHHQNIVQIYDLGRVRDTYFISMEYIRGKDLRTVLNRLKSQGQFMLRELAVFIAREICKGLDYAHNITDQHGEPLSLVHRDISPPNILLSLEGEVKIIDFGIAKATSQATDTQAGVFKGKFAYMAPEQATGIPVDRRSDVFATGLILWEMLTCKKLLEAESDILTLERAKKIDSYNPPFEEYDIPEQLENIIRKALRQNRETRYQSAGEMARDLTIYLNLNYPGFSETDLADFLRVLFNLDRRRGVAGDLVSHGQGERSLTGSDFFKALANTGQDQTDPSLKLSQAAKAGQAPATAATAEAGASPEGSKQDPADGNKGAPEGVSPGAAAAAAAEAERPHQKKKRKRPNGKKKGEGQYWSLENDIKDEIEVFAGGAGSPGGEGQGWVSQVAVDFVRSEDGSLHPLISNALSSDGAGTDGAGALSRALQYSPEGGTPTLNVSPAAESREGTETPYQKQSEDKKGAGIGIWVLGFIAFFLSAAMVGSVMFPTEMHTLKERLGLIRKAPVVLNFQPEDAEVLLNGQSIAHSGGSVALELDIGQRHQIVVRKEGYEEKQIAVDLISNTQVAPLNVSLVAVLPTGEGKLELEGLLPGAVVYVDDWPTVPEQWSSLPTGVPLTVRVVKEHYLPFESQVTLGKEPVPLTVTLRPQPVTLQVESTPPEAKVFVDGTGVGVTPFTQDGFEPGNVYKIEVSAPGYKPYATIITPPPGAPYVMRVVLASMGGGQPSHPVATTKVKRPVKPPPQVEPSPKTTDSGDVAASPSQLLPDVTTPVPAAHQRPRGTVQVQIFVTPWAEVYIDGRYVGRTPVTVPVKAGRHTIRLVNKELNIDFVDTKDIEPPQFGETQSFRYDMG